MACWLMGMAWPLILILMGEPTDRKMSEAFFSAISWNSRFIVDMGTSPLRRRYSPRNSSLMLVFARVLASTCFTITAQYRPYLPSREGRVPGTTTEPAGTRPYRISPLARSEIRVLAVRHTPIEVAALAQQP